MQDNRVLSQEEIDTMLAGLPIQQVNPEEPVLTGSAFAPVAQPPLLTKSAADPPPPAQVVTAGTPSPAPQPAAATQVNTLPSPPPKAEPEKEDRDVPQITPVSMEPPLDPSSGGGGSPQGTNSVNQANFDKMEAAFQRIERLEKDLLDHKAIVKEMRVKLTGTLGYGARQSFTCASCSAQGFVSLRLTCTNCGVHNRLAWHPRKEE